MNPLEKEILKYEKKGFNVAQKRTLKHGVRVFLAKEVKGFLSSGFEGIYLYYVDGDCTTDNLREFFKDYAKFYVEQEFGKGDKAFLLCTGNLDENLFKDLRKAMISDEIIRDSIKAIRISKEIVEKATKKEEETKKIVGKAPKEVEEETLELESIIERIKRFVPHKAPKKEKDLDNMLVHYLSAFYPNIATQLTY